MTADPNLPSGVSIVVLGVTDLERSVGFYRDVLGLELTGQAGALAFLAAGNVTLMLNGELVRTSDTVAGATELVFPVGSVTSGVDLLVARGCDFLREPREVTPGSWAATFAHPDGHRLTLFGAR
jgi:catechol 2,3-dioxygenase-like lactoylglutathione lyase family enzyme